MGKPMTGRNERTFRDLARELRAAGRSERTISAYHQACLSLERAHGGRDLLELDRADIQDWLMALRQTHAADGIVSYFKAARRFYNWAVEEEYLDESPMRKMPVPKGSGRPVDIPETDDIRKLLAVCEADKTWAGKRDAAMIRTMCQNGGARAGEVARLLVANVDMVRDMMTLQGKTGIRSVPLEPKTARAYARWERARNKLAKAPSPRWFVGSSGDGAMTPNGVYQMVARRCAEAGIARIHPHQFRHWTTDRQLEAGMPEGAIVIMNGWTSRQMLDRYGAEHAARRAADAARDHGIGGVL
jgi:site-specific recombinase XerD